ncbi:MAG: glycosyltransferase family 61 protein [Alphaproteobacteria bacterium]|nr:glycosyltransferase family 61 protein [Alphaproteobacteria bacterium]MBF0332060.1 glycosyltransferase family 61 protein [Alphaproteobacteria bacterium]
MTEAKPLSLAEFGKQLFRSDHILAARLVSAAATALGGFAPPLCEGCAAFTSPALDGLAKQVRDAGYEEAANLVAAAAELVAARGPVRYDHVDVHRLLSPAAWGEANGRVHRRVFPAPRGGAAHLDPALLPAWREDAERYLAGYTGEALAIEARDATVTSHGWVMPNGRLDEQHDVFAANGDMLIEDPFWVPGFVGGLIFRCLSNDQTRMLIDWGPLPEERFDFPAVFLGSKSNWSHWLVDFLSRVRMWREHPEADRYRPLFGRLNANQRRCLPYFGIDPDGVAELPVEKTLLVRRRVSELLVVPTLPSPASFEFVRDGFARRTRGEPGPRLVYLSRRTQRPRHRVENDDEIASHLERRGFAVICIETLPFEGQLDVLADAEVIVMSFGGDVGNLAMCNPRATVVMMFSGVYAARLTPGLLRREVIRFVYGTGLPTVPLYGRTVNPGDGSLDAVALFDTAELDDALGRALELAAARRE